MALSVYNSLTNKKEPFTETHPGKVTMYVCGMTVYSDAHIGHARTYLSFDIIRRYLQYKGYEVIYVQNITDVDDKIINASNEKGMDALEYSAYYTERCLGDLDRMGIHRADVYPKASESIQDMIRLIQKIIENGFAYESQGDVYFNVEAYQSAYNDYGKLSGQNPDEMKSGARITSHDKKQSPLDFALWKSAKPGEPSWPSPWGEGRPGWHIECSVMSARHLGLPFDIHGGGMDLRFPHHENEIAQSKAGTGEDFARFWMHSGLLTVNGEKMSKSLGNFITVSDGIERYGAEVLRIFFAQAHYRSPPDFSEKNLEDTKKGLERIHRFEERLEQIIKKEEGLQDSEAIHEYQEYIDTLISDFEYAMDDDFNTPKAFAVIYEFINKVNRLINEHPNLPANLHRKALDHLHKLGSVLTLFEEDDDSSVKQDEVSVEKLRELLLEHRSDCSASSEKEILDALLIVRQQARDNKDWAIADSIRDGLDSLGYEIQDTSDGAIWRRKK